MRAMSYGGHVVARAPRNDGLPATRRKLRHANPAIVDQRQRHPGATPMASPFYTAEHEAYREVVRRFVEKEIAPFAHEWDEAGGFPRDVYEKGRPIRPLAQ